MPEARPSLRRRLLGLLLATTGGVWLAIAAATFIDARARAAQIFDAQLEEYSEVLAALGSHEAREIEGTTTSLEHGTAPGLTYQVYEAEGRPVMLSHAAPRAPLATADGFGEATHGGTRWRVLRRTDPASALVIVVAHEMATRDALVRDLAGWLVLPLLVGLPLMALGVWVSVARSMAPLDQLAAELVQRAPDQLEPVAAAQAPREVLPLVTALNALFARVEQSFENERRFTGDAAHELRTPLAALKTQAQVALTVSSEERRRQALEQVVAGVDRATRLVEQLLALARLDAAQLGRGESVDLGALAAEAVADFAQEARLRGMALALQGRGEGAVRVRGDAAALQVLARNLVENAIRHVPPGGRIHVSAERRGGEAVLTVEDSGPGVAPELRERIFDRFFRAASDGVQGSGLGLSIARRVVELHGGRIRAETGAELHGLAVIATFPADKDSLRLGA